MTVSLWPEGWQLLVVCDCRALLEDSELALAASATRRTPAGLAACPRVCFCWH